MNTPGIICIETEWEHTIRDNRLPIHTEPLLEFIKKDLNEGGVAIWEFLCSDVA